MSHPVKITFTDAEWAVLQERFPHEKPACYCRRIIMGEYGRHRPRNAPKAVGHVQGAGDAMPVTARASGGEAKRDERVILTVRPTDEPLFTVHRHPFDATIEGTP